MFIQSHLSLFSADIYTPVELYLSLRHHFRKACLLENNDYHSRQNSKSFIGCEPIVEITLERNILTIKQQEGVEEIQLEPQPSIAKQVQTVLDRFQFEQQQFNGFFGRMNFEFNLQDETHIQKTAHEGDLPDLHLFIFRYLIVIDHFTSDGYLLENSFSPIEEPTEIYHLFQKSSVIQLPFETVGKEVAHFSDSEFSELVKKGKAHCERGDVFQLVLSNEFRQGFFGDDFQVYRELRRLNPSPYLFYFDFESYRLFGSSPEAQLLVNDGKAEIHPIAGTVPLTGDETTDGKALEFLLHDEKENAEHTMLVDLARNDLSRDCAQVTVEKYKEVQHFSHVTHLVSKVTGQLKEKNAFEALCHSFPAGTLSGTPKPKALELIQRYEGDNRNFYGGAIGILGASGNLNTAIVIRSILSQNNELQYRAGAGIVLDSDPDRETQEVHHKLRALRSAIARAEKVGLPTQNIER
ncbi:MAG: anthranilate synthase component I family protein [Flavobacteriales bacterium]|nr:anthranilate synthase component I family protein [Flavobacteriales bacterium]